MRIHPQAEFFDAHLSRDYTEGAPRIVLLSSGTRSLRGAVDGFLDSRALPHLVVDPTAQRVAQLVPLDKAVPGRWDQIGLANAGSPIIFVALTVSSSDFLSDRELAYLAEVLQPLVDEFNIPLNVAEFSRLGAEMPRKMTVNQWREFSGVCGTQHMPTMPGHGPCGLDSVALAGLLVSEEILEEGEDAPTILGTFRGRAISEGSKGKNVEKLQEAFGLEVTGEFDEELAAHVTRYKEIGGLEATDEVDGEAWEQIDAMLVSEQEIDAHFAELEEFEEDEDE